MLLSSASSYCHHHTFIIISSLSYCHHRIVIKNTLTRISHWKDLCKGPFPDVSTTNHHTLPSSSSSELPSNEKPLQLCFLHMSKGAIIIIIMKKTLKWKTLAMSFFSTSGNESQIVVVTADIKPTWITMIMWIIMTIINVGMQSP